MSTTIREQSSDGPGVASGRETSSYETAPAAAAVAVSAEKWSYIEWPAVISGALIASAVSLVLITFGSAVGLSVTSPWSPRAAELERIGWVAAAWLAFTYIWSYAMGGYLAGRMRPITGDAWRSERWFRDGVNGLVVWAIGVVACIVLIALAAGAAAEFTGNAVATDVSISRDEAAWASFLTALVMLLSGVAAWFAACWGGGHRDRATTMFVRS